MHQLCRSLVAELRRAQPSRTAVDELCLDLLELMRMDADVSRRTGVATRALVDRVRAEANARYTDPALDLIAEAAACGMSRTRFVHSFVSWLV